MKTKLITLFSALLIVIAFACSKDNTVPVRFLLTDNPVAYDSVNVHIVGMQVKVNNEAWIDIETKDTTVNLLDLQDGVTMILADDEIPDGTLKEVRFILGPGNYVVVDGTRHDMSTPSSEDSGLKVKIDKDLNETMNTFVLDFDAALSVKEEVGNYKLMPVIKLK
ncbi:MAG TPA: DUF4382 domain-containing protein [Chitinophagaceae bacterium]